MAKIEAAVKEAVAAPDIREKFEAIGMEMRGGGADEMRQVLAADIPKWDRLVRERNIKIAP